jgi:hypothetical protein
MSPSFRVDLVGLTTRLNVVLRGRCSPAQPPLFATAHTPETTYLTNLAEPILISIFSTKYVFNEVNSLTLKRSS